MDYASLIPYYQRLEQTTKRLEKTAILAELFKNIPPKELKDVAHLAEGRVFPDASEQKIGFSSQLMKRAIGTVFGVEEPAVASLLNTLGDLGKVAEELGKKKRQRTLASEKLTIHSVVETIQKLATLEGAGTVKRKIQLVSSLLSNSSPGEARFIVSTILETLRIGVAEGIVRDAIAQAFEVPVGDVEKAHDFLADYGEVAFLASEGTLHHIQLLPGKPFHVMLAVLVKDVHEGFECVGKPAEIEYKYDGFRVLCHKFKGKITLFTRRLEDVTRQFPELVAYVGQQVTGDSFILDSEVIGHDPATGKYLPFQAMSQRIKRKYGIEAMAKKFPVEMHAFDVLYYNGKSLFDAPFKERRSLLEKIIKEKKKALVLAKHLVTADEKVAEQFYQGALQAGHEGLIFKALHAAYKPGRYVGYMAKLKPVLETLDLVIVKAEWGEGRRAQWLSSYTVACRGKEDALVEIGKVSTGMKEKKGKGVTFEELTKELKPFIQKEQGKEVTVKPSFVVEIAFEEVQRSPTYGSGFALRFPRIVRVRFDRGVSDISTLTEVLKIYAAQRGRYKQAR